MALKDPIGGSEPTLNITQLRERLRATFDAMRADAMPLGKAKEIANVAGKILKSVAIQVEYANAREEKPEIPFAK